MDRQHLATASSNKQMVPPGVAMPGRNSRGRRSSLAASGFDLTDRSSRQSGDDADREVKLTWTILIEGPQCLASQRGRRHDAADADVVPEQNTAQRETISRRLIFHFLEKCDCARLGRISTCTGPA